MKIPFLSFNGMHPAMKPEMMQAFETFYDNNWFVLGERVKEFEAAYAAFNKVQFALGISNGLDALHIALRALEIGPGDEVIVPSNTYIATALAVSYVGATPVFAEPDPRTYNLKADSIEKKITPKTKAIMPVHLYGQACEMDEIMALAKKHGIRVIEDNAQAHGATYNGKITGSFGDINGTSFYPGKNLGALGDGGGITTDNAELAHKAGMLRNYGSEKKYVHDMIGFNMRLDECQAAFLSIKLKHLNGWTAARQQIAAYYDKALAGINDLVLPHIAEGASHVYHLYVVRTSRRDALMAHLADAGVGTLIHYPTAPHMQKAYAHLGFKKGDFPIAEEIADTCLSLPVWPGMKEEELAFVCDSIKRFFDGK